MKLQTKINLIGAAFVAVPIFIILAVGMMLFGGGSGSVVGTAAVEAREQTHQEYLRKSEAAKKRAQAAQEIREIKEELRRRRAAKARQVEAVQPAGRYESVDAYFKDAYPNPLSHRFNEPRFERDVSSSDRKRIIERDGGCCLVCGSTRHLECDHRIAIMNNGGNEDSNLGTLCDECHKVKTRLDWKVKKQRRKKGEHH